MGVTRFIETVRHLRPGQIKAQVGRRLPTLGGRRSAFAPPTPEPLLSPATRFVPPSAAAMNGKLPSTGRLSFLNKECHVGWPPAWSLKEVSALWNYNLHYHDFLWELPFTDAARAAQDWVEKYPNRDHAIGWDPYPVSIRIQNWCMFFFGNHQAETLRDPALTDSLWTSLVSQASWLERNEEWHLLGNHLLENAAALTFMGATFSGSDAARWFERGVALLEDQLDEIVLPDGGHVERSPMYQARLCLMLENLVRTGSAGVVDAIGDRLDRASAALRLLLHPDGDISLLNDSAFGVYPLPAYHGPRPSGRFELPQTGYFGALTREGHYVVCDAGRIGPDYQPGHGHGDTLSFELSFKGQRFVVDSGVYGYETDSWRDYARSTAAHNTIRLNRLDQSDFWAAFRVGSRAYPRNVDYRDDGDGFKLEAEHTGYERLEGRPVHRRMFRWHDLGVLMVRDRVVGATKFWSESRIHLHPDVQTEQIGDRTFQLTCENNVATLTFDGQGRLTLERSWYFPEFGRRFENDALVLSADGASVENGFCLAHGNSRVSFSLENGAIVDGRSFGW